MHHKHSKTNATNRHLLLLHVRRTEHLVEDDRLFESGTDMVLDELAGFEDGARRTVEWYRVVCSANVLDIATR